MLYEKPMRLLAIVLLLALVAQPVIARMGDLDTGYGQGGFARFTVANRGASLWDAVALPDGATILAGASDTEIAPFQLEHGATLGRLRSDGTLDPTFGDGGIAVTRTGRADHSSEFRTVEVDDVGRALAGGYQHAGDDLRAMVARFLVDGTPDASFGNGGRVLLDPDAMVLAIAPLPDGRILLALTVWLPDPVSGEPKLHQDVVVRRLLADGSPDASFGDGGRRVLDPSTNDGALDLVVQRDGRIVVVLTTSGPAGYDLTTVRLHTDGSIDGTWGTDGRTTLDLGFADYRAEVGVQRGDRLILASSGDGDLVLARLDADGRLDRRFGRDGIARKPGIRALRDVVVDDRDRIIVSAMVDVDEENAPEGALLVFRRNGSPERGSRQRIGTSLPFDADVLARDAAGGIMIFSPGGSVARLQGRRSR